MKRTGHPLPPLKHLEMRRISKTFVGSKVLRGVDLTIYPGEVHALMGENGAGKSTLMKILAGAYHADAGSETRINGELVTIDSPAAARAYGIAIIYQELALAANMTVAENIYLGHEISRAGLVDRRTMNQTSDVVLRKLGASFGAEATISSLSVAERQLVEIARALNSGSRVLIMDEPTTALSSRETDRLFSTINELRAAGLAIIYISHRMAEVYALADRVTVLRDGILAGSLDRPHIEPNTLVRMMVGRELSSLYTRGRVTTSSHAPMLRVRNLSDGHRVRGCSLEVASGEVVGLAGMVGSGRTELAHLIFGAVRPRAGEIAIAGETLTVRHPRDAMNAGLAYLTEDRKFDGLFLDMAVADNITVSAVHRHARLGGLIDRARGRERAKAAMTAFRIRAASPAIEVGSLSGGNQQKVLLSRLLELKPKVLILDEPTRGVDIGAKAEIYRIIDELAQLGVAILVISSELPEVIGISDRVLVMREGQIVGGLSGEAMTQENIVALATGHVTCEVSAA